MTRLIRATVVLGLAVAGLSVRVAAQGPPSAVLLAQAPEGAKTMTEDQRNKLDAFLKKAVADRRPELLSVIIRPTTGEGAEARIGEVLGKLGLKVNRTLSGGRLLLVTLKAEQLPDIAASADVARVSFDAFVTPQAK
jgi:uncharacterized membrane protein YgcG